MFSAIQKRKAHVPIVVRVTVRIYTWKGVKWPIANLRRVAVISCELRVVPELIPASSRDDARRSDLFHGDSQFPIDENFFKCHSAISNIY